MSIEESGIPQKLYPRRRPVAACLDPINYRITDDDLGAGSPKEKVPGANPEAIRNTEKAAS